MDNRWNNKKFQKNNESQSEFSKVASEQSETSKQSETSVVDAPKNLSEVFEQVFQGLGKQYPGIISSDFEDYLLAVKWSGGRGLISASPDVDFLIETILNLLGSEPIVWDTKKTGDVPNVLSHFYKIIALTDLSTKAALRALADSEISEEELEDFSSNFIPAFADLLSSHVHETLKKFSDNKFGTEKDND